ncbi:MAG: hypothetical protein LBC29_01005 [Propionibacteriaceae bacterium]|jgi:hypothetical protein|nr:hypothetical protein [Propionibacteriaceae bacterium]
MASTQWPPVVGVDTPLPVFLCPEVGRGLLVLAADATEEQFSETADWLSAVEWTITDNIVGENTEGAQVVELAAVHTGVLTVEALAGADEQLAELAKLV